ncbi:MAG: hypothetical protein LBB38_03195 [Puniceicoccales bacterium]|jgi:DNA polymerase III delta subunit|nr:hypothetical protein [Puniceicoccales bacterium]
MDGGAHLLCGDDDVLVGRRAEELIGDCQAEILSGRVLSAKDMKNLAAALREAVMTPSLFGGSGCVWVRSAIFLGCALCAEAAAQFEKICETLKLARDLGVAVVLSASPVDRRLRTFKMLKAICRTAVEVVGGQEGAEIAFADGARHFGLQFDFHGRRLFLEKIGQCARNAYVELEKLDIYLGERRIVCAEDVAAVVCESNCDNFFEPVDAFYGRDLPEFEAALRKFFGGGGELRAVLAALQSRNRVAMQLKAVAAVTSSRGRISPHELAGALDRAKKMQSLPLPNGADFADVFSQNRWYLCRVLDSVERFSLAELLRIQIALRKLFSDAIVHWQELSTDRSVGCFLELFHAIN